MKKPTVYLDNNTRLPQPPKSAMVGLRANAQNPNRLLLSTASTTNYDGAKQNASHRK